MKCRFGLKIFKSHKITRKEFYFFVQNSLMDWIHCNKCTALGNRGGSYWFTSCGHIICSNCIKQGGPSPGHKSVCIICQKTASIMEINRSMRPEIVALFKPPRELVTESSQRLKAAMDLQNTHRQSLFKKMHEKYEKAVRYAKVTQAEMAKRDGREKALLTERDQLKQELETSSEHIRRLEQMLKEREHEIQRLRKSPSRRSGLSPHRKRIAYPSLNGNTPITSLSFLGCGAMSTPNEPGLNYNYGAENAINFGIRNENNNEDHNIEALFRTQNAQEETPIAGPAFCPTTPYIFAMARGTGEQHTDVTPKYF
uniref:RING-type domain-containing protein n=1 Tax=Globodera rostochiensis TaxID=31243 RepID=A0A914HUX9_GLORO